MHVKTYTGTSTQEVLALIKAELGPDAVILGSRTFRKNGVRCHEMTAGLERDARTENTRTSKYIKQAQQTGQTGYAQHGNDTPPAPPGWSEWHREWREIKDHLFALMKPALQTERLTPRQRVALEYLQREGVSDAIALRLYRALLAAPGSSVLESLSEITPVRPWNVDQWSMRTHCFTGPFGVGKTTTALRMALHLRTSHPDMRIAFVNADAQRGNGRLVLRHWAELSDFSYMEAHDAQTMQKALVAVAGADRVFIDMPGLGRDATLATCRAALGLNDVECATHLVLAPHHDSGQMPALLARYAVEGEASLVWVKLDEAVSYGALINVAGAINLPISALSYGPGLRETLMPATESLVWRLIFKRELPS